MLVKRDIIVCYTTEVLVTHEEGKLPKAFGIFTMEANGITVMNIGPRHLSRVALLTEEVLFQARIQQKGTEGKKPHSSFVKSTSRLRAYQFMQRR